MTTASETVSLRPYEKDGPQVSGLGRSRPRVGFLGVGWIGRHRLEAIARAGTVEIAAIAEPAPDRAAGALKIAPRAMLVQSLQDLLASGLDGLVIATPSALHAEQAVQALEQGLAVFCQKPLGRTAAETRRVVDAARAANVLLGVDFSYRFISGIRKIRELCRQGQLGRVFAADLVFHNAYGPDKPWFYQRSLSGGGCLVDLGIHLVDLALWCLDFPRVAEVNGRVFAQGKPLRDGTESVEDYATARLDLDNGSTVQLACSWKASAGCDAIISGTFYGTKGGAAFRNVDGSFYNFTAEQFRGTQRMPLTHAQEEWGGRAAVDWATRLAGGVRFDPEIEHVNQVAQTLDAIYQCGEAAETYPDPLPPRLEEVCAEPEKMAA